MIVQVGDAPEVVWHVRDDDGEPLDPATVTATLALVGQPPTTLTVTHPSMGEFSVVPAFSAAGDWQVTWTSTGPVDVHVDAFAALLPGEAASWAPSLRQVAAHIPSRTRVVYGDNNPAGTFTDDTAPTGDIVQSLIDSAVATVGGMVGHPVVPVAYPLCQAAASLWASYWVELGYPERDSDVSVYGRLRDDALLLTKQAEAVNLGAGGGTVDPPDEDGIVTQLPSWSFPPPVRIVL